MSAWSELVSYATTGDHWSGEQGITHRAFEHLRLSAVSVLVATAVALPVAGWLGHIHRGGVVSQWLVNVGRAIPSLALVALVLPIALRYGFGLGFWPTVPALVLLAIPPLFVNTFAGVSGVPRPVVDASEAMGMRPLQVLLRVEVPTALPLIITGVRVATLQVIATATLGAYVGFNGLGSFINEGFSQQDEGKLLVGAGAVAVIALAVDGLVGLLIRRASPWRRHRAVTKGTT